MMSQSDPPGDDEDGGGGYGRPPKATRSGSAVWVAARRGRQELSLGLPRVDAVEPGFLLVAERAIETGERGLRQVEDLRHRGEALLHRGEPAGRRQGGGRLALALHNLRRLYGRIVKRLQSVLLRGVQREGACDALDRQTGLRQVLSLAKAIEIA